MRRSRGTKGRGNKGTASQQCENDEAEADRDPELEKQRHRPNFLAAAAVVSQGIVRLHFAGLPTRIIAVGKVDSTLLPNATGWSAAFTPVHGSEGFKPTVSPMPLGW